MFIRKVPLQSNLAQIQQDLNAILSITDWGHTNQIGLRHRPGAENSWQDSVGSLYFDYDLKSRPREQDFSEWNKLLPNYLREQLTRLAEIESCDFGRVRFMRMLPKQGLSVHNDTEKRYHLVIKTNPFAYIGQKHVIKNHESVLPSTSITYHIPLDGNWYEVDTTQTHYVYNGGKEDRIHLVACKL